MLPTQQGTSAKYGLVLHSCQCGRQYPHTIALSVVTVQSLIRAWHTYQLQGDVTVQHPDAAVHCYRAMGLC